MISYLLLVATGAFPLDKFMLSRNDYHKVPQNKIMLACLVVTLGEQLRVISFHIFSIFVSVLVEPERVGSPTFLAIVIDLL